MAVRVRVIVLAAPDTGVLCPMLLLSKVGTSTRSGSAPLLTPYRADPGLSIATWLIDPMLLLLPSSSPADTLTAGDDCPVLGFVRMKVTVQAVPDEVPPDAAVSTSTALVLVRVAT